MIHKLTVTLKQHTPLIHFQHSQPGATLRASEVKPKLDKYILNEVYEEGEGLEYARSNNLLIGDSNSLKYKVKIINQFADSGIMLDCRRVPDPRTNMTKYETAAFPMLLSNMGGKPKEEFLHNFVYYNTIQIVFITSYDEISDFLQENVCDFFADNNFGCRSGKGFGSYTVSEMSLNGMKLECETDPSVIYGNLPYMTIETSDYKKMFACVDYYWKRLKSGVNYNCEDGYHKSYLYTYLNEDSSSGYTWEKRKIKTHFNLCDEVRGDSGREACFARAQLGLPDVYEYAFAEGGRPLKQKVAIKHKKKDGQGDVMRIKAPIIFKPIIINKSSFRVYMWVDDRHLSGVENQDFVFSCKTNRDLIISTKSCININDLLRKYNKHLQEEGFYPVDFRGNRIAKVTINN